MNNEQERERRRNLTISAAVSPTQGKRMNQMFHKYFLYMFLIIFALLLGGCSNSQKPVKIVMTAPLEYGFGQAIKDSVDLALKVAEYKAGDIPVELVFYDTSDLAFNPGGDAFSPEIELKAAQLAIDDPDVVAYVGSLASHQAKASMALINQAGLAQISPTASWPGLTKPGYAPGEPGIFYPTGKRHFFRMSPTDDAQGVFGARWAKELGFEKAYVVHDGSIYSYGLAGIFEVSAPDNDLEIVGSESYDADAGWTMEELDGIAARVAASGAGLLFFPGRSDEGIGSLEFVSAVLAQAPNTKVMVGDALVNYLPAENYEGILATNIGAVASDLEGTAAAALSVKFEETYGETLQSSVGTTAYELVSMLLQAIQQAEEPTRDGVLAELTGFAYSGGIYGDWHFDENGDLTPAVVSGWMVQDGEWTFVQVLK